MIFGINNGFKFKLVVLLEVKFFLFYFLILELVFLGL